MPDLVSPGNFTLRLSPYADNCCGATNVWIDVPAALTEQSRAKIASLNAGLLGAMCYPEANPMGLQVCADYCTFLFHLDDLTDELVVKNNESVRRAVMDVLYAPEEWREAVESGPAPAVTRLMYDIWIRVLPAAGTNVQRRFTSNFDLYFQCTAKEAAQRASDVILGIDAYILHRREAGTVRPCFALIEFAADIDLPEEIVQHPIVRSLEDGANDLIAWGNDVLSYNVE